MGDSIGKQLNQARLKQGLSIEDIAHETRIPVARLRDLEEDNYAEFPSPTYARSFLTIYSEFLDVDALEFLDALKGPNSPLITGNFVPPALDMDSDQTIPIFKSQEVRKEGNPLVSLLIIILLILIIPTVFFIGQREAYDELEDEGTTTTTVATDAPEPGGPAQITPDPEPNSTPGESPQVMAATEPDTSEDPSTGAANEEEEIEGDRFSRLLVPTPPAELLARDPELDALINSPPQRRSAMALRENQGDSEPADASAAAGGSGESQGSTPRAIPFSPDAE